MPNWYHNDQLKPTDISKKKIGKLRDKVQRAKYLGMNTVNIFTNKTNVVDLEKKLDKYIESKK